MTETRLSCRRVSGCCISPRSAAPTTRPRRWPAPAPPTARWSGPTNRPPAAAGAAEPGCRRRATSICRWSAARGARQSRAARLCRGARPRRPLLALRPGPAALLQMAQRPACRRQEACRHPARIRDQGGERVDFVVIGIGTNLASKPEGVEFPATSLAEQGFPEISPARLGSLRPAFRRWAQRWRAGVSPRCARPGWPAPAASARISGCASKHDADRPLLDLDQDGALLLGTAEGRRRIAAGEVFPAAGCPAFR